MSALAEARLQPGDVLPQLQGKYLSGREATLPADARGKYALLAFGFTYDSRFPVEAWGKEYDRRYKNNPQITFYEIPMISGFGRLAAPFIDSGMRKGTPKDKYENVITVYGGAGSWKKALGVGDEKTAYLVLLDPEGTIRWMSKGPPSPEAFEALGRIVSGK